MHNMGCKYLLIGSDQVTKKYRKNIGMVVEKTKNVLDANFIISQPNMVKYAPQFKHEVLQQYTAGDRSHSFEALA